MTSLRKRLDISIKSLGIVREKIENCDEHPPCCLTFHRDSKISCDVLGPMPEKAFLEYCAECRRTMKDLLDCLYEFLYEN